MSIIYLLLPAALVLGFGFLIAFVRSAANGQYDDLETPDYRILLDDESSTQDSQPLRIVQRKDIQ